MERKNYYLHKDKKSGEILYLEYDKIKGYPITPKTKIEDAIDVHKIIFINPTLQEKLIRKKVEIKLKYFRKTLEEFVSDEDSSSGDVERVIIEAEKLRMNLLSRYIHYLGNTYGSIYLNQLQQIMSQLKVLFFQDVQRERYQAVKRQMLNEDLYYLEENEKKGRGR